MSHHGSAQPALLSDRRGQESRSRARNHVLAALDSTCHEPPCTPYRLRTSSFQHCTILPRKNQECRSPTRPGGSSQTLQPGNFPGQLPLPSHRALRLSTVATWRRIRPNRCTRSHLQSGRFLLPRTLACSCPCCQPWTGYDATSDVGASLPHAIIICLEYRPIDAPESRCRSTSQGLLQNLSTAS